MRGSCFRPPSKNFLVVVDLSLRFSRRLRYHDDETENQKDSPFMLEWSDGVTA
jgi:hypothetical protein